MKKKFFGKKGVRIALCLAVATLVAVLVGAGFALFGGQGVSATPEPSTVPSPTTPTPSVAATQPASPSMSPVPSTSTPTATPSASVSLSAKPTPTVAPRYKGWAPAADCSKLKGSAAKTIKNLAFCKVPGYTQAQVYTACTNVGQFTLWYYGNDGGHYRKGGYGADPAKYKDPGSARYYRDMAVCLKGVGLTDGEIYLVPGAKRSGSDGYFAIKGKWHGRSTGFLAFSAKSGKFVNDPMIAEAVDATYETGGD